MLPKEAKKGDYQCESPEVGDLVKPQHHEMSSGYPSETLVTVTFAEQKGKTKLTLHIEVSESVAKRQGANVSWAETLDRLADYVTKAGVPKLDP